MAFAGPVKQVGAAPTVAAIERSEAACGGHRVDRRLVAGRFQHRKALGILRDQHRDGERQHQFDHRGPGEFRTMQRRMSECQLDGRVQLECAGPGDGRNADDQRADHRRH